MIWVGGRVVFDNALKVSVLDRTFEHGLGLFETLRTWRGRAPLLERHLARLKRSAELLKLPYASALPPDDQAVAELVAAEGLGGEVMLRITLSGGTSASSGATLWMRSSPLPAPTRREGAVVDLGTWWVQEKDPFCCLKSLNYWSRRLAHERAKELGFDEVLSVQPFAGDLVVWEGSRTNVFIVTRDVLRTPDLNGPLVPGIMRALVIERAAELALDLEETDYLTGRELLAADEVFLTNSVRGIVPVARIVLPDKDQHRDWVAPGAWTQALGLAVGDWVRLRVGDAS